MRSLTLRGSRRTSMPRTSILPLSAGRKPSIISTVVLLARAVGAEHPENLARLDLKGDAIDGAERSVGFDEIGDLRWRAAWVCRNADCAWNHRATQAKAWERGKRREGN